LVPVAADLDDTEEMREVYFDEVIDRMENVLGESFRDDIVVQRSYAHRDFVSDYNSYKGSALGMAHTLWQTGAFRPYNRSRKLDNLYFAGQYTHPGIGVPMVIIAAEITCSLIQGSNE